MNDGFTLPLTLAAYLGNCANINALLEHGAEINKRQPRVYGPTTALSSAIYGRHTAAAELLIKKGADCDIEIDGISEIALNGDMKALKGYVRHEVSKVCIQAALRVAAGRSYNDAVKFLLELGANADGFEDSEEAEILERIPMTDEDREDEQNKNGDEIILFPRDGQRAKLLNKERVTPLVNAISNSWYSDPREIIMTVELLVDAGADVNHVSAGNIHDWGRHFNEIPGYGSEDKTTPLFTAAFHYRPNMAKILIRNGALVNLTIDIENTAMTGTVVRERQEQGNTHATLQMLKLLTDSGADPGLCAHDHEIRIRKLLAMSHQEVEMADALKKAIPQCSDYLDRGKDILISGRKKIEELIAGGADPEFCCPEDAAAVRECLRWSDKEVLARNAKQEMRRANYALQRGEDL